MLSAGSSLWPRPLQIQLAKSPGLLAHAYNPNTWEARAEGLLRGQGQHGLHNKFKAILGYIMRSCLKTGAYVRVCAQSKSSW